MLALLFASLAAPVALAGRSSDEVCAMACCVAEGHCCCKPRRAYVEGHTADGQPRLVETTVAAPCPEGCALPTNASPLFLRQALRPAGHRLDLMAAATIDLPLIACKALAAAAHATSPRAPPVRLAHLAN